MTFEAASIFTFWSRFVTELQSHSSAQDGSTFKATLPYCPYFFLAIKKDRVREVETYLQRTISAFIHDIEPVEKLDSDQPEHLYGGTTTFIKLSFFTVQDLLAARRILMPFIEENQSRTESSAYEEFSEHGDLLNSDKKDYSEFIVDIREYDVPYYERVMIDLGMSHPNPSLTSGFRISKWYDVKFNSGKLSMTARDDLLTRAHAKVLAFDIETTKEPLKFPDERIDQVFMISYMIDGQGYLIINREIVSQDIDDFDYNAKRGELPGPFHVFNEKNEVELMERFVKHIKEERPQIFVTFNGDKFDWKFLEARARILGMPLSHSIGLRYNQQDEYYSLRFASHLDAFCWVKRDSYLPQGSQGLKAVTKAKLGYNPEEIDPEEMMRSAKEQPQKMASYSVSDAVATYYLYMKYVHPFIFSLASIIPMRPDDVLRKGTGTLCEALLMVEAFKVNVIFPNKKGNQFGKLHEGHLIESETYVGGHVESLAAGVYRNDIPLDFHIDVKEVNQLKSEIDHILDFAIQVEAKLDRSEILNYEALKADILAQLEALTISPKRTEKPYIYHVDVAAMYPNIILTNRLQPSSMVDDTDCATCIFNQPENQCKRKMDWQWRVEYYKASKAELNQNVRNQLEVESLPMIGPDGVERIVKYHQLPKARRDELLAERVKNYSKSVYKKATETEILNRSDVVCMRENPFYVDTVRAFRDRRYVYRTDAKVWGRKLDVAKKENAAERVEEAENMVILYESLQLAHKCILNSFYGYVMRKGARWYSMEMAAIVTHTGANIIKRSRELIERIGKPLELDTDGIWCALPSSFPENFDFQTSNPSRKSFSFNFVCTTLNARIHKEFTNHQYQTLEDAKALKYSITSECSIFFEVDGPYRAMVLPTSTDEGKQIKKRYAIFHNDGSLAELKGFEIKRRGELKMIKDFQEQIFKTFLNGSNLVECYQSAASVANYFLDILETKGENLPRNDLLTLISESRNISKELDEYSVQKSAAITTAKRLGEFFGGQLKEKGLNCRFVIARFPPNQSTSQRAIPTDIFYAPDEVQARFIRKWCNDQSLVDVSIKNIVDWDYYHTRFAKQLQKLITIPAYFQGVDNPIKRVPHPDWVHKKAKALKSNLVKLSDIFKTVKEIEAASETAGTVDIEDIADPHALEPTMPRVVTKRSRKTFDETTAASIDEELASLGPVPDPEDEAAWLEYEKRKWKLQRERRKKRKVELGGNASLFRLASGAQNRPNNLTSFLTNTGIDVLQKPWQILQIASLPGRYGEYKVWFLTSDTAIHSAELTVSRIAYVNSYAERHDASYTPVKSFLPRMRTKLNLYEFEMSEAKFQSHHALIQREKADPAIEGLYETQLNPAFRAIMELGNLCSVKNDSKGHSLSEPWGLHEFKMAANSESYLKTPPKYFYLYQSGVYNKTVFGIYMPANQTLTIIYAGRHDEEENVQAILQRVPNRDKMGAVTLQRESTFDTAIKAVNSALHAYRAQNPGPLILVAQTSTELENLGVTVIEDVPVMIRQANKKDDDYPSLRWLSCAASLCLQRALLVERWYLNLIEMARYAQVPLCNIATDDVVFLSDVLFARRLKLNDNILWFSETSLPDLGGNEEVDFVASELVSPERCYPDCIETVSIEISVHNLAINTIINAGLIPDLEGSIFGELPQQPKTAETNVSQVPPLDDSLLSQRAFKILQGLVTTWLVDANMLTVQAPELFVRNLYRWLSTPSSYLYEPALHKLVHKLIKKVFLQLLSEFKKLGAKIIYANLNRVIIATNKHTLGEAESYFTFLQETFAKNRELFRYLKLDAVKYWDVLLFKDPQNYVAFKAVHSLEDSHEPEIEHALHLADYLPAQIQQHFLVLLGGFVQNLFKHKHKLLQSISKEELAAKMAKTQTQDAEVSDPDGIYANIITDYNRDTKQDMETDEVEDTSTESEMERAFIHTTTEQLYNITRDAQKTLKTTFDVTPVQRSTLVNPEFVWENPALEFVKVVCHMLSLKKSIGRRVATMKRNLLRGLSVKEFSKEAEFVDPVLSFVLDNVICGCCNESRQLDLLRDPLLVEHDWKCQRPECGHLLDKAAVEDRLVEIVSLMTAEYHSQDIRCEKCKQVKMDRMKDVCTNCSSGNLQYAVMEPAAVLRKLVIFEKIGQFHGMHKLLYYAQFLKSRA